jgi:hypothetical protein
VRAAPAWADQQLVWLQLSSLDDGYTVPADGVITSRSFVGSGPPRATQNSTVGVLGKQGSLAAAQLASATDNRGKTRSTTAKLTLKAPLRR